MAEDVLFLWASHMMFVLVKVVPMAFLLSVTTIADDSLLVFQPVVENERRRDGSRLEDFEPRTVPPPKSSNRPFPLFPS